MTNDSFYYASDASPSGTRETRPHDVAHTGDAAQSPRRSGFWMAALCLFMVGAVLFAVLDHPPAHWTELWPLLLVLLCPLLHVLMHQGHGSH